MGGGKDGRKSGEIVRLGRRRRGKEQRVGTGGERGDERGRKEQGEKRGEVGGKGSKKKEHIKTNSSEGKDKDFTN